MARMALLTALVVCAGMAQAQPQAPEKLEAISLVRVTDGDTLWVRRGAQERPIKLRIEGIDAPESCQAGGQEATAYLRKLVSEGPLQMKVKGQDVHHRVLARVWAGRHDLGARMVLSGQAWSYRFQDDPGPYARQEQAARRARRGLHALDQPEHPRDFRRRHGPCEQPER